MKIAKNIFNNKTLKIILLEFIIFIYFTMPASTPLVYIRDNYMASYQVGLTFTAGTGSLNVTGNFPHSPDISPTNINYKMFGSTGFGSDYSVTANTLSLQFQIAKNGVSGMTASLYSDYIQNFHNYVWVSLMVIDVLSPAYSSIIYTTTRFNNLTLAANSYYSTNVAVSTMNSTNLVTTNDLKIYSFMVGYILTSSNTTLQFSTTGEVLDAQTIRVNISSTCNLINVTYVRVDTVVVDKTLIEFSGFLKLDFQTADCPTHSTNIVFVNPSYSLNYQNMITGLSFFTLNANRYYMTLTVNADNVTMTFNPSYNFIRIIYSNLAFVNLKCPTGYPNYDKPTNMCYNTVCTSIGFYRIASPDQCLACLYDCYTCTSGTSCASCNASLDHRVMNNISRCQPVDGYYDDGTNNSVAQPCVSPCLTCQSASNCTSCISDTYYIDLTLQRCLLCSSAISLCLTCNNSYTCTSCQDGFYVQSYSCSNAVSGLCYKCSSCLFFCKTCADYTVWYQATWSSWQVVRLNGTNDLYIPTYSSTNAPLTDEYNRCEVSNPCTRYWKRANPTTCNDMTSFQPCANFMVWYQATWSSGQVVRLNGTSDLYIPTYSSTNAPLTDEYNRCEVASPCTRYWRRANPTTCIVATSSQTCDNFTIWYQATWSSGQVVRLNGTSDLYMPTYSSTNAPLTDEYNRCEVASPCTRYWKRANPTTCNVATSSQTCDNFTIWYQATWSSGQVVRLNGTSDLYMPTYSSTNAPLTDEYNRCEVASPCTRYWKRANPTTCNVATSSQTCDNFTIWYQATWSSGQVVRLNGTSDLYMPTYSSTNAPLTDEYNRCEVASPCTRYWKRANPSTCNNLTSCISCNSTITINQTFDQNNLICVHNNGYCDDMTDYPFAQLCASPCLNCFEGINNYCTSCINDSYYLNTANYQCKPCQTALIGCLTCSDSLTCTQFCQYTCFTCNNPTTCLSCDSASDFRIMNASTSLCDPINGYYDNGLNNSIALPCTKPCGNCFKTATNCTSCINNTYYYNSIAFSCVLCKTAMSGCLTCSSSSVCTLCDSSFGFTLTSSSTCACSNISFLSVFNHTCTICNSVLPGCQICPNELSCTTCSIYFYKVSSAVNNTYCQQICGDGRLFNLQCDDGNLIDGDGCSSNCTIEPLYTCNGGSATSSSTCFYIGNIDITTISYIKTPNKNQIQLKFLISPCSNISNSLINQMLVPQFPYQSMQLTFDSSTCYFSCQIMYNISLSTYSYLQVQFKFPLTANFSSTNDIKVNLNSIPDNNFALKAYDEKMYNQMNSINNLAKAISYLFIILFFIGFISGLQLYSLELMFIIQYAYAGLLTINKLQLSMESLKYLYISFGIFDSNNLNPQKNAYMYDTIGNPLPTRMKSLGFSPSMTHNINGSLIVPWAILLIGSIIYLVCHRFNNKRWKIQAKNIITWWVPYWLVIIQMPTMVSMWITWNYQNSTYESFPLDIFVSVLYLFINLGLYAYIFNQTKFLPNSSKVSNLDKNSSSNKQDKQSKQIQNDEIQEKDISKKLLLTKQIRQYFKERPQQKMKNGRKLKRKIDPRDYFYFSVMVYRLLVTLDIVFLNYSVASNVVCMGLSLVIFFYICFALPYQSNIRPIYNGIVVIILSIIFAYQKSQQNQGQVNFFSFYGVVFLLSLLLLTLIVNGFIIIKQAFQRVYNFVKQKRNQNSSNKSSDKGDEIHMNQTLEDISVSKQSAKQYSKESKKIISRDENNKVFTNNQKGKSQGGLQIIDLSGQLQNHNQPQSIFNLDSVSQKRF